MEGEAIVSSLAFEFVGTDVKSDDLCAQARPCTDARSLNVCASEQRLVAGVEFGDIGTSHPQKGREHVKHAMLFDAEGPPVSFVPVAAVRRRLLKVPT